MHKSDVNAEWLQRVLHESGHLPASTTVTAASVSPIGTGQVADSVRVELDLAGDAKFTTLVAKVSSDNDQSRAAGRTELNYLREVRFYQEIAPRLPARVPDCYYAEIDSNGTEFALLLEDLSPAAAGNQLEGSTLEQVENALKQAARFHAPFWGDESLKGSPWLDISATYWQRFEQMMPQWWDGFRDRYDGQLSDEQLAFGNQFVANISSYYATMRDLPATVQHGDFRPDNLLFGVDGDPAELAVVDWQTVLLAPGPVDAAYCVGGALTHEVRRANEDQLLAGYIAELRALGVQADDAEVAKAYAAGTLHNFIIGVAAAMLVTRTERGDALFLSMVTNAVTHAVDRNALREIGVAQ